MFADTNLFLKLTRGITSHGRYLYLEVRPHVVCADGFTVSVQAGYNLYSTPRLDTAEKYERVELGYPNMKDDLITEYAEEADCPTDTVYPYVPVEIVDKLLEKHGGIIDVTSR